MWTGDIESAVFTRVKTAGNKAFKTKYRNIFYTTENETDNEAVFPTVYLQELTGSERGRDLEGIEVHAMLSSFQIDVSDNDTKQRCKEVMENALSTMKSLKYEIIGMPIYRKSNGVWLGTARCRRVISKNDIL